MAASMKRTAASLLPNRRSFIFMPIETALLQWRRMSDLHGCDVIGEVFSHGLSSLFPNTIPGRIIIRAPWATFRRLYWRINRVPSDSLWRDAY